MYAPCMGHNYFTILHLIAHKKIPGSNPGTFCHRYLRGGFLISPDMTVPGMSFRPHLPEAALADPASPRRACHNSGKPRQGR